MTREKYYVRSAETGDIIGTYSTAVEARRAAEEHERSGRDHVDRFAPKVVRQFKKEEVVKMKRIILDEAHREAIAEAIKSVEGRATARLTTVDSLLWYAENLEQKLGIPKKYLKGCRFSLDPNAQDFPQAYRYVPESTQAVLEYGSGKWYVTDIRRARTRRSGNEVHSELTDEAKAALIRKYETMSYWALRNIQR